MISSACIFSLLLVVAQSTKPPAFVLNPGKTTYDTLEPFYWELMEDPKGEWAIKDMDLPSTDRLFHPAGKISTLINQSIKAYWIRFRIVNPTDRVMSIGFKSQAAYSKIYINLTDGKWMSLDNGLATPWNSLDGLKLVRFALIVLKPHEEILVIERVGISFFYSLRPSLEYMPVRHLSVVIGYTDQVVKSDYIENETHYFSGIHDSVLFGFLVFVALFNFFFYLIVKEKVYLFFALFTFSLGVGRLNDGFELFHLFFREVPKAYAWISNFVYVPALFFLTYFVRHFLNTKKYYPRLNKFLYNLNFVTLGIELGFVALNSFSSHRHIITVACYLAAVWILYVSNLVTIFLFLKSKTREFVFYGFGIAPAFTFWSLALNIQILYDWLNELYGIRRPGLVLWLAKEWDLIETICITSVVLSFCWILLHQFSELRKEIVRKELEKELERSKLIAQQKVELEMQVQERTADLKKSFENLRSTQAQLIQSEKMASLGELTAGIAHEIQNPLNFVNNFSDVNSDLINELKTEMAKPRERRNESREVEMIDAIMQNIDKISVHGRRAESIVKAMLQHSRKISGQKEPIDINALTNEYLRLAYHGFKAKDQSFSVSTQLDCDPNLGKIDIIPQEIGRVILNLLNNAFYAVSDRKKHETGTYEPLVSIMTRKLDGVAEIIIKDNGNGIPQKYLNKIFQPFFTTKAAGEGTGLGLSLSYDIVKAHGGAITVETKESFGTTMILELPSI
jgi:signal transduction histidine kinase